MIMNTKTGVLVVGELSKDPEFRETKGGTLMRLSVRYDRDKNEETGKWMGKFIDVNLWRVDERVWGGMLQQGDTIQAIGKEISAREYNGKTYHSLNADSVGAFGADTIFRWLQLAIDTAGQSHNSQEGFTTVDDNTPFEAADPNDDPLAAPAGTQATMNDYNTRIIANDDDDLPF